MPFTTSRAILVHLFGDCKFHQHLLNKTYLYLYLKPKQHAYLIMEVRHWRSVSTFGSLPSFLAFFVFFCPFFPFFAENTPNQIRWGILRYSRWRERHSFVPGENTKKGKKLAHIVVQ